jgi:hypothetical protein
MLLKDFLIYGQFLQRQEYRGYYLLDKRFHQGGSKMKRLFIFFLLLLIPSSGKAKIIGDFNNDGKINIMDLIVFLQYLGDENTSSNIGDTICSDQVMNLGDLIFDNKGIKIDSIKDFLELGKYGDGARPLVFKFFTDGREVINLETDNYGGYSTGIMHLISDNGEKDSPNILLHGMNLKFYHGANFILPDWKHAANLFIEDFGDAFFCWDYLNHQIKIRQVNYPYNPNDNWIFTPDLEGDYISGAKKALNDPTQLKDCVSKADFDSLVIKLNAILTLLKESNIMADSL